MSGREIPWSRWIPKLVTVFVVLLLIALILPAIDQAREAARGRFKIHFSKITTTTVFSCRHSLFIIWEGEAPADPPGVEDTV